MKKEITKTLMKLYPFSKTVGLAPGTLIQRSEHEKSKVDLFDYKDDQLTSKELDLNKDDSISSLKDSPTVSWINIVGQEVEVIKKLGTAFKIHPLILEDIVNTGQRPKIEDHDNQYFIVVKMLHYNKETEDLSAEQVGLVLGNNYLLSFQEKEGDVFDPVRKRIEQGNGRIRTRGPDYLAYALIDAIVDHYYVVLEQIGEKIEEMEYTMLGSSGSEMPHEVHQLKRQMLFIRKNVWPLREVVNHMYKEESELIDSETQVYIRDVYDHTIQVIETIETLQETLTGLLDMHLSYASHRMNEVMKVLTVFAAIFIPLTFIAGIYGMNFEHMPELHWKYGYLYIWSLMGIVTALMLWYFRRNKWI